MLYGRIDVAIGACRFLADRQFSELFDAGGVLSGVRLVSPFLARVDELLHLATGVGKQVKVVAE